MAARLRLTDGRTLVEWVEEVAPLPRGHVRELMSDFRKVTVAGLVSTVATAAIQALVALVGFRGQDRAARISTRSFRRETQRRARRKLMGPTKPRHFRGANALL